MIFLRDKCRDLGEVWAQFRRLMKCPDVQRELKRLETKREMRNGRANRAQ